ncbi:MAG: prephenate dehydrogenase/arogenate dehydrogenase family protein [Gemmataceae bacterium]|nr:prephenate dehydrogenase/arogenate dehydrogenase family protein [Gemmata sp.]MDW8197442.1 prephenate dehydrogenase/arogenate dehydrogenase family protein [Gemmataceae bacterium]
MQFEQIAIVGIGLIGGSVGLAAQARGLARHVVGIDPNEATLHAALERGAISRATTQLAEGVQQAQLVVVCTPVDRIVDVLRAAFPHAQAALYTDVGSVKYGLAEAVEGQRPPEATYLPAHPLAGAEKSGVAYARADLFAQRVTVVTPRRPNQTAAEQTIIRFWEALGSHVVVMDAAEHDRVMAVTSHLPHAVASALAAITPPAWLPFTAGGFRDSTRIAASDPRLWAAILAANRHYVRCALEALIDRFTQFRQLLATGDTAGLEQWLVEGKQVRDALGT